jgi:hypothetical protein
MVNWRQADSDQKQTHWKVKNTFISESNMNKYWNKWVSEFIYVYGEQTNIFSHLNQTWTSTGKRDGPPFEFEHKTGTKNPHLLLLCFDQRKGFRPRRKRALTVPVGREALLFFVAGSDGRTRAGPRKLGFTMGMGDPRCEPWLIHQSIWLV